MRAGIAKRDSKKLPFAPFSIIITPSYENPVEILIQEDRR
jgi:hypothetical protein